MGLFFSWKHSALDLCVRFISQIVSKCTVTQYKLVIFLLYFKEELSNNQISPSINL